MRLPVELKRQEIERIMAEVERLVSAAEDAYEQAVAIEEWENEEDRDS